MEYIFTGIFLGMIYVVYAIVPTYLYKWAQFFLPAKKRKEKVLFLTFDDGPDPQYTGQLLDLLEQHQVVATFFSVATFAKEHPMIVERMKQEGHVLGLHSCTHQDAWMMGPGYTERDFTKSMEICDSLGVDVHFYRPPWGRINICTLADIKSKQLKMVLWDVMAQDWKANTSAEMIASKLKKRASNGKIICLHDGRGKDEAPARTIEALKKMIPEWKKEGYRFATVEELYESKDAG